MSINQARNLTQILASKVFEGLVGLDSGGKPPFPTLRLGEVLAAYLSPMLGNTAGASHPS